MPNKLAIAEHLTADEHKTLLKTYVAHNRSLGLYELAGHNLGDIVEVRSMPEENAIEVLYVTGRCWLYYPDGSWVEK